MAKPTQHVTTQDTPRAFGYCAWHKGNAEGVRLIDVIEQGSAAGGSLFACPPCMEMYRLTPFADRP